MFFGFFAPQKMSRPKSNKPCIFCEDATENPVEMGEMLTYKTIKAHNYCLMLSSGLTQRGEDDEGINGFLPADINIELARAAEMKCCYCARRGASIGCCHKSCRKAFHLPCAIEKNCLFQFTDTFRSFCHKHHGIKKPKRVHAADEKCTICLDKMGEYVPVRSVQSPCCSMWFHKRCLMETAHASGYFFKCPLCNNKDKFRKKIVFHGIAIPDSDAKWEEPNAYAELTERPTTCSADDCKCPQGRNYIAKNENTKFSLIYCELCGSFGIHKHCNKSRDFYCKDCYDLMNREIVKEEDQDEEEEEQNNVDLRGSDNAELELSSENVRRIELETGSHGSTENSNSLSSSAVESAHMNRPDLDTSFAEWLKSENGPEILVHTKTSSCSSNSTFSASTSVKAVYNSEESDTESENYIRSMGLNTSMRIYSDDDDDSNLDSITTETASETTLMMLETYAFGGASAAGGTTPNLVVEDGSDEEDIKPVVRSPEKYRLRVNSSSSSTASIENTVRWFSKRKRASAFRDSTSDNESLIENQDAVRPNKTTKLQNNNNYNNASTPLLEDNKHKWCQSIVKTR